MPRMPSNFRAKPRPNGVGSINVHSLILALFYLALFLVCSYLTGCCKPCVRPTLLTTPHPIMELVGRDPVSGVMDDASAYNVQINLEKYAGALDKCNAQIIKYNDIVKGGE